MKRVLFLLFVYLPVLSYSQIDKPIKKGNIILGGNGSISNLNYREMDYKLFSAHFNPTCNLFLVDNLATGLTASISYDKLNGDKSTKFAIGPNIKYYFNNGILLRAESLVSLSKGNSTSSSLFSFKSGIGYAIFLNSKVSIEPSLLYYHDSLKSTLHERELGGLIIPAVDYSAKQDTFIFEIGFCIFL